MNFYEQIFSRGRATGEGMTHFERLFAAKFGGSPPPKVREYTGAVPVTITADGTPLIDLLISGNEEHTGTPTPDNPIMPQGTGERTGNLFSSTWEQGSINGTTGQNEVAGTLVRTKDYIPINPNTAYSFSRNIANGYMNLRLYRADKSYISSGSVSTIRLISGTSVGNPMGSNTTFCCFEVIDSEAAYIRFNDSSNNKATKWYMVEGEYTQQTMPDYEPYGYKIPISSANTTTPVYLGEVETTRKIYELVLTGNEDWLEIAAGLYRITKNGYMRSADTLIGVCSHFGGGCTVAAAPSAKQDTLSFLVSASGNNYMYFSPSQYLTTNDFKSYLAEQYAAGTPVTVWYVLATEETAVINEPLMKIGDYADTLSKAQAGVEIPTNNGSTAVDVDTTVKPSEVYIKYMG